MYSGTSVWLDEMIKNGRFDTSLTSSVKEESKVVVPNAILRSSHALGAPANVKMDFVVDPSR